MVRTYVSRLLELLQHLDGHESPHKSERNEEPQLRGNDGSLKQITGTGLWTRERKNNNKTKNICESRRERQRKRQITELKIYSLRVERWRDAFVELSGSFQKLILDHFIILERRGLFLTSTTKAAGGGPAWVCCARWHLLHISQHDTKRVRKHQQQAPKR